MVLTWEKIFAGRRKFWKKIWTWMKKDQENRFFFDKFPKKSPAAPFFLSACFIVFLLRKKVPFFSFVFLRTKKINVYFLWRSLSLWPKKGNVRYFFARYSGVCSLYWRATLLRCKTAAILHACHVAQNARTTQLGAALHQWQHRLRRLRWPPTDLVDLSS